MYDYESQRPVMIGSGASSSSSIRPHSCTVKLKIRIRAMKLHFGVDLAPKWSRDYFGRDFNSKTGIGGSVSDFRFYCVCVNPRRMASVSGEEGRRRRCRCNPRDVLSLMCLTHALADLDVLKDTNVIPAGMELLHSPCDDESNN